MSVTTIPTAGIADTAVSTAKIADDAVTASKAGFDPGKIVQIVNATYNDVTTTSTSYSEFASASITRTSSTNNVLINWSGNWWINSGASDGWVGGSIIVVAGGSRRFTTGYKGGESIVIYVQGGTSCSWYDTTDEASTTYSFQIGCIGSIVDEVGINGIHDTSAPRPNTITLMELAT